MGWIDKTSGQDPQWIQPQGTRHVSNNGRVEALKDVVKKMPVFEQQMTPRRQSIYERGVKVMPPMPNQLNRESAKPRRPAPPPPAPKPEKQPGKTPSSGIRPRSQVITERPGETKALASRSISKVATPLATVSHHASSIQKATHELLDHHLGILSSSKNKQQDYRALIQQFKPSTLEEGDDEFSEIESALHKAAKDLGKPELANDPAAIKDLQKHFYRRLVSESAKLLGPEQPARTVKKVPPKPPVRTSSLPGYKPPEDKGVELKKQSQPLPPVQEEKASELIKASPKSQPGSIEEKAPQSHPEPMTIKSEVSLDIPAGRRRKRKAELDAPAKYMAKSLARNADKPWKEQMPKFFTRYLRAMALTGASSKANVDKQWFNHEVPGSSIFSKNNSAKDTQKELRHRLEDIAFQKGDKLTGFYRFCDQHQLGRNVRMATVSQMMLPLSEHGHLDPMTLRDLEPHSGTEVSRWLNDQLEDITRAEYAQYTELLADLKDTTEAKYRVDLGSTPYGKVPLEDITAKKFGEGVFRTVRVNSFTHTLEHCMPWLKSAHPVTDKFAELRLRDTTGEASQKLTAGQLEDLNNQARELLNEMGKINMNKVPRSVQDTMTTEKKSLEKIVEKYQQLSK